MAQGRFGSEGWPARTGFLAGVRVEKTDNESWGWVRARVLSTTAQQTADPIGSVQRDYANNRREISGSYTKSFPSAHLTNDVTPFVREQLKFHPRFKGESLRFVVLQDDSPQATSNSLALRIRDRLRDAAADVPGVRIAWQPGDARFLRNSGPGGVDCTRSEVHYLIGVEMRLTDSGLLAVGIRALDIEDRSVVAGFSKTWEGPISSRQYREFRRIETDLTFRGEREAPYEDSQTDLLAVHLAHDLGCKLLRQTEGEYLIMGSGGDTEPEPVDSMVELVSNNLTRYSTLQFSSADEVANAVIEGKAHQIDGDLYQYWITVQPKGQGTDLQTLSASAYVRRPEQFTIAAMYAAPAPVLQSKADFLASLQIVALEEPGACRARRMNEECYALAIQSKHDAVVFFLNHQLNNGLVRLADTSCPQRSSARIVRTDQQLRFALPPDSLSSAAWSPAAWALKKGSSSAMTQSSTPDSVAAKSRAVAARRDRSAGLLSMFSTHRASAA